MGYVDRLLASEERVVRVSHDHWVVLLPMILMDVAVVAIVVGLAVVGASFFSSWTLLALVLLLVPLAHLAFRLWVWWNKQYVITNRRIIQVSGNLNKRVSDTLLEKVNDILTEQSAMGRLLKFGDVEIIAGSECGTDKFCRLADPIGFKRDMLDQKAVLGGLESPERTRQVEPETVAAKAADVPELIAELADLREKGLLTDVEFEEKKRKLLDRI